MVSGENDVHAACVRAINARRAVAFDYQGRPRFVLPMAVGQDAGGETKLRGLQIGGGSSTGTPDPNDPKLFFVARILNLRITGDHFEAPPRFAKGDTAFRHIDAEL